MKDPLISVIVPVYNTEKYLGKCLDSIIQQTYRNLEIICVDDESTDRSGEILDEYAYRDSRIKVLHRKNAGVSAARNAGLAAAAGEWVTGVDSDDYLEPDIYEKAVEKLSEQVDILVFGTRLVFAPGASRAISEATYQLPPHEALLPLGDERRRGINICFWNKLWRRSFMEKYHIEFPEGLIHEDSYLYRCLAPLANGIYVFPRIGYNYVQRTSSHMDMHSQKKVWEKYMGIEAIVERVIAFHSSFGSLETAREYILPFWMWGLEIANGPDCPPGYASRAMRRNRDIIARYRLNRVYGNDMRLFQLQSMSFWQRFFMKVWANRVSYRFFGIPLFSVIYENNRPVRRESAWLNAFKRIAGRFSHREGT